MKTKLNKYLLLICILFNYTNMTAQDIIKSNESYTNITNENKWILTDRIFTKLLLKADSLELYITEVDLLLEQVSHLQKSDSIAAKTIVKLKKEKDDWYKKLLKTQKELEKIRIARARFWNRRTFWFIIGGLTTAAVISLN